MPGHKYISRYFKNGKWRYVYKDGKKYSKLADDWGKDEYRRMFEAAVKAGTAKGNLDAANAENKAERAANYQKYLNEYNKAVADYKKTPMGKLDNARSEAGKKITAGAQYIANLFKKKK